MNEKLCVKCSSSEISPEGIYCKELDRWVGRCSEQQCILERRNEQYETELKANKETGVCRVLYTIEHTTRRLSLEELITVQRAIDKYASELVNATVGKILLWIHETPQWTGDELLTFLESLKEDETYADPKRYVGHIDRNAAGS